MASRMAALAVSGSARGYDEVPMPMIGMVRMSSPQELSVTEGIFAMYSRKEDVGCLLVMFQTKTDSARSLVISNCNNASVYIATYKDHPCHYTFVFGAP